MHTHTHLFFLSSDRMKRGAPDYHHSVYLCALKAFESSKLLKLVKSKEFPRFDQCYKIHILHPDSGSPGPLSNQAREIYYLHFEFEFDSQDEKEMDGHHESDSVFFNTPTFSSNPYPSYSHVQSGSPHVRHAAELAYKELQLDGAASMSRLKGEPHPLLIKDIVLQKCVFVCLIIVSNQSEFHFLVCLFAHLISFRVCIMTSFVLLIFIN
jgi:hypothetical protein